MRARGASSRKREAFRNQSQGLARGLEPELTVVLDSFFPMDLAVDALRAFSAEFPTVPPRVYVPSLGAAARLVLDGTRAIGLLSAVMAELASLPMRPFTTMSATGSSTAGLIRLRILDFGDRLSSMKSDELAVCRGCHQTKSRMSDGCNVERLFTDRNLLRRQIS